MALVRAAAVLVVAGMAGCQPGASPPSGTSPTGSPVGSQRYNEGSGRIMRANLDGSRAPLNLITGLRSAAGVAVDGHHLYWSDDGRDAIGRANLDGSEADYTFINGSSVPTWIAIDGRHIYWDNQGGSSIGRANLDGSDVNQRFITRAGAPKAIAVNGQYIYWVNKATDSIGRANLDGSGANPSFITPGAPSPAQPSGRGQRLLIGGLAGLTVDGRHIYWADEGPNVIGRADFDGSNVDRAFIGGVNPTGLAVDSHFIYWSGPNTIERAELDGSHVNHSFITGVNAASVAVDSQHLYWAND